MKARKTISYVSGLLLVVMVVTAFILSYSNLQELASSYGLGTFLSHLWPLMLDAFMLSAGVAVLESKLTGKKLGYPWLIVGTFTIVSVTLNALHAPNVTLSTIKNIWLGVFVFSLAPLVVFLAFELFMRQVTAFAVTRNNDNQKLSKSNIVVTVPDDVTSVSNNVPKLLKEPKKHVTRKRRNTGIKAAVLQEHSNNPNVTHQELSDIVGCSRSYVTKVLGEVTNGGDTPVKVTEETEL